MRELYCCVFIVYDTMCYTRPTSSLSNSRVWFFQVERKFERLKDVLAFTVLGNIAHDVSGELRIFVYQK